jgi:hypothetical protein
MSMRRRSSQRTTDVDADGVHRSGPLMSMPMAFIAMDH